MPVSLSSVFLMSSCTCSPNVQQWYHYIPIKNDYSDLHDVAAYFIGAPDGTGSHDTVAQRIASQGKAWTNEHWREVDMCVPLHSTRFAADKFLTRKR